MAREYVIRVTQDASSQPVEHRVAGLPVSMGREAGNDIQVASQFVSSSHAKIEEIKGRVFVRDLGSRNGVFVNSVRVERRALRHGDLLTIGETQFRFVEAMAH